MKKIYTKLLLISLSLSMVIFIIILFSRHEEPLNKVTLNQGMLKSKSNYTVEFDTIQGVQSNGTSGVMESVSEIMARQKRMKYIRKESEEEELPYPDRTNLPQNPDAKDSPEGFKDSPNYSSPQTVGTKFHATELDPVNWLFPADNMGAVGPAQVFIAVNNKFKTFNKSTGTADGIIDVSPNVFFNSVRGIYGTSDPRVRYDRASGKWFIIMINVPDTENRILIAVSDGGTITSSTVFTFFYIPITTNRELLDYPTLGIDANALYIGGNIFRLQGTYSYQRTDGYVIRKSSITGAGPIVYTLFSGLASGTGSGPYTPQGVDNYDASPTYGYFIGVDNVLYGTLMLRRVSNPGGTPTISSNISITNVSTTARTFTVPHLGNSGGENGYLDALDDRLYAAMIRNGSLYTAHSFNVNSTGTATGTARDREGVRWYQIQNLESTPSVTQTGTVFDNSGTNPLNYFIPAITVSGQGHVAATFTRTGANNYVDMAFAGKLATDPLNTLGTPVNITTSTTAYNPVGDAGGARGRRWGDYSFISVDPNDNMTMWAVHGYCSSANIWGVYAAQLKAPPPAVISSTDPSSLTPGNPSLDVIVYGTSVNGSGFYDPGTGYQNRLSASVTPGVTVNSVTYISPTQVNLNVNTTGMSVIPGDNPFTLVITNPDGQISTFESPLPVNLQSYTYSIDSRNVLLKWKTSEEINNSGFDIERKNIIINHEAGFQKIGFIKGKGTTNNVTSYTFEDRNLPSGKYKYRLKQIDYNGNYEYFELNGDVTVGIPTKFDLSQNYPNPFNPVTKINFDLPEDGKVNLRIYDILGREVAILVNEVRTAGYYTVSFDASNFASGVYFYRLSAGNYNAVKKLVLIR
jgi:hypothetical protein